MMKQNNSLKNILLLIEVNLDKNLNLEKISKEAGYSKYHLNRIFKKQFGINIYQYVKLRRLTEAAKQLVFTNKSILEIALNANYSSQQSFTLAFKSVYFCSPHTYRTLKIYKPLQDSFILSKSTIFYYYSNTMKGGMVA